MKINRWAQIGYQAGRKAATVLLAAQGLCGTTSGRPSRRPPPCRMNDGAAGMINSGKLGVVDA